MAVYDTGKFNEQGLALCEAAGLDPATIPARPDCIEVVPDRRGLKVRGWKVRYRTIVRDPDGSLVYEQGNVKLSDWKAKPLPRGWENPSA